MGQAVATQSNIVVKAVDVRQMIQKMVEQSQ